MTCNGDHVRKTYRPLPAVPCVVGLVGCKGCVGCLESPYVGRLGSPSVHRLVFTGPLLHRAPVGEGSLSLQRGATWYEPRMSEEYRVSMREVYEVKCEFPPGNPGGYPFWASPVTVYGTYETDVAPLPIDMGRASEIGVEKGSRVLPTGERLNRFVGPFRRVAGDGDCLDLLHLGWGTLCTKLCVVDCDEVLRARSGLLRMENFWDEWSGLGFDFPSVAELLSDTPSWLREEVW
jgi:hypothetical protein